MKATFNRWEPFRGASTLQEQVNRLFGNALERSAEESNLTLLLMRQMTSPVVRPTFYSV